MSKLKTSSTSSESATFTEKEFQLAKQQMEMKAGEALFREASRKIMEQRDKDEADSAETNQNQPKDTAYLSDIHFRPNMDKTIPIEENLQWVLEMAGKDWEAFWGWQPDSGMSLPAQLKELSKLYLDLLEAALKYTEGENLSWQLEYLDALLARKLHRVIEKNLEPLMTLLEQTRETSVMNGICSSLYRQTAGQTLSPQAIHRLFYQETLARSESPRSLTSLPSSPAASSASSLASGKGTNAQGLAKQEVLPSPSYSRQSSKASSSFSEGGMIYQSSRKQNVRYQQVYDGQKTSWKEQIRQRKETITSARNGISENTFRSSGLVSCSGKDLERANRLAAHFNGRGNLFQNPDISARNDEVIGLLAAVMSIKGQVYRGEAGGSSSLALSIQKAIEKIIDHYLSQKEVTNVYYHTLALYKKMKDPQKAIQSGQDYAYQRFREKQKNPVYQKSASYSRESGFFQAFLKKLSPEKEFALGNTILQRDWENFLRAIGTPRKSSYLSRAEKYSPWGILLDPGTHHTDIGKRNIKIFFCIALMVIIVLLAVFFSAFLPLS